MYNFFFPVRNARALGSCTYSRAPPLVFRRNKDSRTVSRRSETGAVAVGLAAPTEH